MLPNVPFTYREDAGHQAMNDQSDCERILFREKQLMEGTTIMLCFGSPQG
jgi:hypothetical protein